MAGFGLRRTQSLKSLSGGQERSGVMPAPTRWDRKSVSQLVQHYQSCADLSSIEKDDHKLQESESCADGGSRRPDPGGEMLALSGSGRRSNLSRSRSMDYLPQREPSGTRALCALFESKAGLHKSFTSSPRLNAERDCPLQDWRSPNTSLKDTTKQRADQVEGGKATNGLPEASSRAWRHSHDDKYSPSLTKGETPPRQSRHRISTSSSVRDRSALYLSRAAAIDSAGGSAQPEIVSTSGTRDKNSKFGSPAKDTCSACLTPVYPMERMVANKLILHNNCFCCKHCKKKLSIHNYSSLYGECYCIAHYQQLFKRSGNYDEGFGHTQHKDRWLQKNKEIEETDNRPTPKIQKNSSNTSRESTDSVRRSARDIGCDSRADVNGKLKRSWPPEKKRPGANPAQLSYVQNKTSDIGKALTSERQKSDNNQSKINHGGERHDKVKELSRSIISGVKERSKATGHNSAEKFPPGETKSRSDQTNDSISPRVLNFSSPYKEKGSTVTSVTTAQTNVALTSKRNFNPTSSRPDAYPNKAKKSVRFASDVAQLDLSLQLTAGAKCEGHRSDQTEQNKVNEYEDIQDVGDNSNLHHSSFELSKEPSPSEVNLESHGITQSTSNQGPDVKVESSQEVPETVLNGVVDKVEEPLNSQSFTDTLNSAQEVLKLNKPSEMCQVNPEHPCVSESPITLQGPAGLMTGQEARLKGNTERIQKMESGNDHETGSIPKTPVARTNSLKGFSKQTEKTKVRLGSWSKGKSPMSKLFTSGGSDKTNKVEPKDAKKTDVKPSGGLLGRLFQSSSEKAEDPTKLAVRNERNDKATDDDNKREVREVLAEGKQKEVDVSEEPLQELEPGDLLKERSDFPRESNLNEAEGKSTEPSTSTSETVEDLTAPEQTNTVASDSLASEPSIKQSLPRKKGDAASNDDFFGDSISSAPVEALVLQESAQRSNDLPDEGVRDLCDGAILDLNQELPPTDSPNLFDLVDTTSDAFVSSLMDTALPEVAPTDTFSLLDNHPTPPPNDLILGLTDHLVVPASAPVNREADQIHFTTNGQREDQEADFDIFGSNNALFTPTVNAPHQGGADSSSNQPTAFPDDIFGSSDVFTVLPSTPAASNSLYDWFGSDAASVAPPSDPTGLFVDDIFASEPKLLALSEPSDVNFFGDSLLVSDNSSTEQTAERTVTNSNWMDDLLG